VHAYAISGRRAQALRVLNELKEQSKRRYVPSYEIAVIQAGLGDLGSSLRLAGKSLPRSRQ